MYRKTDPSTSRAASDSLCTAHLEGLVYDWLMAQGLDGGTSEEIGASLGLPRVTVSPRLAPLQRKGLVCATARRRLGTSGRSQIVWVAEDFSFLD
jgi:hypothetical protein